MAGKVTGISNTLDLLRDQAFTYDDNDRLTQAQGIYGTIGYDYDKVGNRQSRSVDGVSDTYSYIPNTNRIQAVTTPAAEQKIFVHDQAGRAVSIPDEGSQPVDTSYIYDDRELRIKKSDITKDIIYHYDPSGNLLAETNLDGSLIRAYIYGAGLRLATMVPNGTDFSVYWHHNDHLGTPQKLTDSTGAVVWSADYLPFGKALVDPSSTITNDIRFPGQIYDAETGLHYNWHRYYNPETGRYMTPDPIGLEGGINLYAYVGGDPVNEVDPTGKFIATGTGTFIYYVAIPVAVRYGPVALRSANRAICRIEPYVPTIIGGIEGLTPGPPSTPIGVGTATAKEIYDSTSDGPGHDIFDPDDDSIKGPDSNCCEDSNCCPE